MKFYLVPLVAACVVLCVVGQRHAAQEVPFDTEARVERVDDANQRAFVQARLGAHLRSGNGLNGDSIVSLPQRGAGTDQVTVTVKWNSQGATFAPTFTQQMDEGPNVFWERIYKHLEAAWTYFKPDPGSVVVSTTGG